MSVATETSVSTIRCSGCGSTAPARDPYPFRCPKWGTDGGDHVMVRTLDLSRLGLPLDGDPNPFIRYRELFHAYHQATSAGIADAEYTELVRGLDDAVAGVDSKGFRVTPFGRIPALGSALGFSDEGGVWIKDETGNVSGSHKGRHLMGLLIHLGVVDRLGLTGGTRPRLAIASCGNAALAAAVVAAAGKRELRVFVPVDADPAVVRRLEHLHAQVVVCPRDLGEPGDPAYLRLLEALAEGALPFTCQGNLNGLAVEGGHTLAYEMASDLVSAGENVDHVVIQVGGGALASACIAGLREAVELGALPRMPRVHTVQTAAAHPLERAYHLVRAGLSADPSPAEVEAAMREAAASRPAYMWPWEEEPRSIATGILDDETYDWRAVVEGMLATGGSPVVVDERTLSEANELAVEWTGIRVDPTGSAGLAGLMALRAEGLVEDDERVAVLFTGVQRSGGGSEPAP
ncbi:MAG TPA: pyridoxal-phosphate dependent enzyme [Actinomycetota bacterium]|nr:pyridoxal-phosphate dependent enzyme [Actinomycetota bacterium]